MKARFKTSVMLIENIKSIRMKRNMTYKVLLLLITFFSLFNCSKDEFVPGDLEVNDFVWTGLNAYYRWQGEISDLSDRRFSTREQLNTYLAGFDEPNTIFQSLLYRPIDIDSVSTLHEDFNILEEQLKGVILTTGMEFEIVNFRDNSENVFAFVSYVHPNSSASRNGVTRGMIFTAVNDTPLTRANYRGLLLNNPTGYSITLADNYNNGNPMITPASPTTTPAVIDLVAETISPDPVAINKTFTEGTTKIGYLLYNEFNNEFLNELNIAFANFRTEAIDELIVDLRYTSNGSIEAVNILASLIAGQLKGEVLASEVWNNKVNTNRSTQLLETLITDILPNRNPLNALNLTKVYFLTSNKTASASEVLINGLASHIDVHTIGENTKGVYNAFSVLYDSENYKKFEINPSHNYALLPNVATVLNKDAINSRITASQTLAEDYGNLGELGERTDPILDFAIDNIINSTTSDVPSEFRRHGNSKENYVTNEVLLTPLK
ncbi:hypothetical protein EYW44_01180 [Tenacibaculum sp. M341]|nr:hypothetical protein EYW44_01180 [Tenacibaculum sp. M341]